MIGIHDHSGRKRLFRNVDDDSPLIPPQYRIPSRPATSLIALCDEHHMNIADMVWANETAMRSAVQVRAASWITCGV